MISRYIQNKQTDKQKNIEAYHLIKVGYYFIQQSQALYSHVVSIQLDVEVVEVWDGGKQDTHLCIGLIVQILI